MIRSWPLLTALGFAVVICGCASHKPPRIAPPPPIKNGSLTITSGIDLQGSVDLPAGFEADVGRAPMWLHYGTEIGVAGNADGKAIVLGFSGPDWRMQHVIAEDFGVGAPHGRLLDIAASPDGLTVATAVAEPAEKRIEVVLREAVSEGPGRPLESFDGAFSAAQLQWLNGSALMLVLRSNSIVEAKDPGELSVSHMMTTAGERETKAFAPLGCGFPPLSFSPDGQWAVANDLGDAPAVLIDLKDGTCHPMRVRKLVRVLAWAPDSSLFLFAAEGQGMVPGVFSYDFTSGGIAVVAISSSAAAFANDGTVIALGNDTLSWQRAASAPNKNVVAQIALTPAGQGTTTINSLGFETRPNMLARSSMAFSEQSGDGMIDIEIPAAPVPLRELIEYSYPTREAFVLASGQAGPAIPLNWSPDGKLLALVDTGVQPNRLTVLAPPR